MQAIADEFGFDGPEHGDDTSGGPPTGPDGDDGSNGPPPTGPNDDSTSGGSTSRPNVQQYNGGSAGGSGAPPPCIETFHEELRVRAQEMTNDDHPLCFAIASIFPDRLGERVGEPSDEVCMYRCSWEEDCNYYMEFDEEDFREMEYESCAGQNNLELEPGCYDMGFCSDRNEA